MQEPGYPIDEDQRLKTLVSLDILDAPPVETLDRITRIAARFFNVQTVLISLIDKERQWFLSCEGSNTKQTPRNISFCGHAILGKECFIIPDAQSDERFSDNPLVTNEPFIRFYAGQPLFSKHGYALGVLCLNDPTPRIFTKEDVVALQDFAAMVQDYLQSLESEKDAIKIKASLTASESKFSEVFNKSAIGIALVSLTGEWLQINSCLCNFLKYTAEELSQKTFQDITHPDDLANDLVNVDRLLKGKIKSYSMEKRYLRKDGVFVWALLTVALARTADNKPHFFISVIEDISERKKAELDLHQLQVELEDRVETRTAELKVAIQQLNNEIAQRVSIQNLLNIEKERFRLTLENTSDAFIEIDENNLIIAWNVSAERIFGWRAEEVIGKSLNHLIIPDHFVSAHEHALLHYKSTGIATMMGRRLQLEAKRRSGELFPIEITLNENKVGDKRFVSAFLHDISERKAAEAELISSKVRLQTIADNMPALISHISSELCFLFANKSYETFFDIPLDQILGQPIQAVIGEAAFEKAKPFFARALHGEQVTFESTLKTRKGEVELQTTLIPCEMVDNGFYILALDISELKRLQGVFEYEASHDLLTELPNRRGFNLLLNDVIESFPHKRKGMSLLFLDLDNFKRYNDKYGHDFGDQVLKTFANVIRDTVRATDIVARLAGDEFTIILTELSAPEQDVTIICQKLLSALERVTRIDNIPVVLSASIGAAICYSGEFISHDLLMSKADSAMYRAKVAGKATFAIN